MYGEEAERASEQAKRRRRKMDIEGLSVACAGLGCTVEDIDRPFTGRYLKGDDCLENLKDLQRYLRRDHPKSRDVFFQLGRWNTVGRNLVPLICNYQEDRNLVLNAVKVVVFLTMPVDPTSNNILQQVEYLHHFKAAFLENHIILVIMALLEEALEHLEMGSLTEDDWKIVQLVITLFRNLLAISTPTISSMTSLSPQWSYMKDAFLECLFQESVMDLLLALQQYVAGSHGVARKENSLFLEIFYHILWGVRPEALARVEVDPKLPQVIGGKFSTSLQVILDDEKQERKRLRLKDLPRHSRFSGTFVQINKDGSRKILTRNPFLSPFESMSKRHQIKRGPVKRVAHDVVSDALPKENVLTLLKAFADQFLAAGYNALMQTIKEDIRKERRGLQPVDIVMFFKVAQFFTSYQCCCVSKSKEPQHVQSCKSMNEGDAATLFDGQICGPISATMDEDMFMLVLMKWNEYSDSTKDTNDWFALASAGALMKDMIRMLDIVLKARDCSSRMVQDARVARILLFKIFYDQTESGVLHLIHQLIRSFDMHKQPRTQLADLVEMAHVVIRLLESLTVAEGTLRVMKKRHKVKQKKKLGEPFSQQEAVECNVQNEGPEVDQSDEHMTNLKTGNDVDSLTKLGDQDSAGDRLSDIQADLTKLGDQDSGEYRLSDMQAINCTELQFGVNSKGVEEFDLNKMEESDKIVHEDHNHETELQFPIETDYGDSEELRELLRDQEDEDKRRLDELETEEDEEMDDDYKKKETDLNLQQIVSMFANNTTVKNYCWLLKFFSSNTPSLNYYIIRMLQRICSECALEPMLYQLSILQTFYDILSDKKMKSSEEQKYVITFLTSLIRTLFKTLKVQPFLFVELLFWKTRQDCHVISVNHMISKLGGPSHNPYAKKMNTIADSLGDDEVDVPYDINQDSEEKNRFLNESTEAKSPGRGEDRTSVKNKGGPFTETQETLIKELFEKFKDKRNCTYLITQALDVEGKYSKVQVAPKLKQLGLHCVKKQASSLLGFNFDEKQRDVDFCETLNEDEIHQQINNDQDTMDSDEDGLTSGDIFLSCKEKKKGSGDDISRNEIVDQEHRSSKNRLMQRKRRRIEAASIEDLTLSTLKRSNNLEDTQEVETSSFQTSKSLSCKYKHLVERQIIDNFITVGTPIDEQDGVGSIHDNVKLDTILEDDNSGKNTFEEELMLEDDTQTHAHLGYQEDKIFNEKLQKMSKSSRRKGFVIDEDE